jgi:D-alanine-D-alanine ligase
VNNDKAFEERVSFIHDKIRTDAVVEQYIPGRELYVSVLGNHRLQVLPTWEIFLDKLPEDAPKIATRKVKWDLDYQQKHGVRIGRAKGLSEEMERRIARVSRRICRRLGTDGCVRIDFRLHETFASTSRVSSTSWRPTRIPTSARAKSSRAQPRQPESTTQPCCRRSST